MQARSITVALLACAAAACKSDAGTDYQRKSMAAEAVLNLNRMARGAKVYAASEHAAPGAMAPTTGKLPPSAPLTPEAGACCKAPGKKCDPNPELWKHPSWQALEFDVFDAHRYSYEFVSTETGFTARAIGDLDCDGTTSLYELYGTLSDGQYAEAGTIVIGEVYKERALE